MATIKVNSKVMRDKANIFKTVSSSISNLTEETAAEINNLKSSWEGSAADTYITKFNNLKPQFENICTTITNYENFLNKAADDYDEIETQNEQKGQSQQ